MAPAYTANLFPAGVFEQHVAPLRGKPGLRFLEIGVFEGKGTRFFFENFLGDTGTLVAIDPFLDYSKSTVSKIGGFDHIINPSVEDRFRSNTEEFSSRIELHKGLSQDVLPKLPPNNFDLIFVDGDHSRDAVASDACQALRLAKKGGYIVFDDYLWGYQDRPETCPKMAIDQFLLEHSGQVDVIHKDWCVVVVPKLV